uniref:Uncharacterized protein n=1 Tax=Cacopsylla melanoneura TaxID=428564 RepID=A0A8D8XH33_9HEMI
MKKWSKKIVQGPTTKKESPNIKYLPLVLGNKGIFLTFYYLLARRSKQYIYHLYLTNKLMNKTTYNFIYETMYCEISLISLLLQPIMKIDKIYSGRHINY